MQYTQPTEAQAGPPSPMPGGARAPLWSLAEVAQLDEAVDYAARVSKATVAEFLAAPSESGAPRAIELAIEFLVPPCSSDLFAGELDRALVRRSLGYSALRRSRQSSPVHVSVLPPGAFHQWRAAWNIDPREQRAARWSADRRLLDGILRQARVGWREIFPVG